MSQALPSAQDCCSPCEEPEVVNIPGSPGAPGAAGAAGADGENAFTLLGGSGFTLPPLNSSGIASVSRVRTTNVATLVFGAAHNLTSGQLLDVSGFGGAGYNLSGVTITVTGATSLTYASPGADEAVTADVGGAFANVQFNVTVDSTAWMVVAEPIAAGFNSGTFPPAAFADLQVMGVINATSVRLQNLENLATGAYASNSAAGTAFASGLKVAPAGFQGPQGAAGTALDSWTRTGAVGAPTNMSLLATGYVKVTTGTGAASSQAVPIPIVDGGTGGVTAAAARTALGLGTMAVQSAAAVAITGGTTDAVVQTNVDINSGAVDGTTIGAATPSTGAFTTLAASGAATLNGNLTMSAASKTFLTSSAIQSLLAATAVNPNASKIRVVGNGGAVTLVATPTITSPAADGQHLIIMGTSDANAVTLQRESALAGSLLRLGAATRVLGLYDTLELLWDSTLGAWVEVGFTDNT